MKIVRWKAVIPLGVFLALIAAFLFFFLDPLLKWGLEKALTAANGAEVNVESVDTRLRDLSVRVGRIQVTDAIRPELNKIEIGAVAGDLGGKPLTWKKFIIEKAEITGLRLGTKRSSPGKVYPAKEDAGPGLKDRLGEWAGQRGAAKIDALRQDIDPNRLITKENLASLKKIAAEKDRWSNVGKEWQGRLDQLKFDQTKQEVDAFVARVKGESFSGIEGVKKAQELIKDAKKVQENLKLQTQAFEDVKGQVTAELAQGQAVLKNVEDLKNADLDKALAGLTGGLFSTEGIAKALIGPELGGKIVSALGSVQKIRDAIPRKKGAPPPPPPARIGRNIEFPFQYSWPTFHLKLARISGQTPGQTPIDFTGSIKDVSTDPPLVGRPIIADLAGDRAGQSITFKATLDFTREISEERFELGWRGIPLDDYQLGDVGGPVRVKAGRGAVTADIHTRGQELSGRIDLRGDPITLEQTLSPEAAQNRMNALIHDVLVRINKAEAAVILSDTIKSPNFKLQTTLDNQLKGAVDAVVKKELDQVRAQLRARLDELVGGQQKELAGLIGGQSASLSQALSGKEKNLGAIKEQLRNALDDLKSKSSLPLPGGSGDKPSLPNLKKIFKK